MAKKLALSTRLIRLRNKLGAFWPFVASQLSLLLVCALAVAGYMLIEGWNVWDSMYMVIITLSTVGYGEVHPLTEAGRKLTTLLILTGVGNFAFILGAFSQLLVEGKMYKFLGRRRVLKAINKLDGHCIICGFGRIGSVVAQELLDEGKEVTVIETDGKCLEILEEEGILHICGDATSDDILRAAGVEKASSLIAALPEDSANVYIVLSARQLNEKLNIVSRAGAYEHVSKLKLAGADSVLMPNHIGGLRMAQSVLRPSVTSFMDLAHRKASIDVQMEELIISEGSELVGKNLIQAEIRPRFNLIVIGIKHLGETMSFNPEPQQVLQAGDTIITVGATDNLLQFEKVL